MANEVNIKAQCGNCRFKVTQQLPPPNIGSQSVCCLFPPVPCIAFGMDPQTRQPVPVGGVGVRPTVQDTDFCFQFQPRPELTQPAAND